VTGAEALRLVLGLVASLVVARALGPADYGVYAVLAAMVGIVGVVAEGGLSEAAVLRIAPATNPEHGRAFFWLRIMLAGVVIAALCVAAGPLAQRVLGLQDDGTLTRWALIGVVATACSGGVSVLLQASGRFREMSALTVLNTALTAALALGLAWLGRLDLVSALVVLGIGTSLLTFGVGARLLRESLRVPPLRILTAEAKQLLKTGRWLWLAALLAMLAASLDVLIVNHFSPSAAVGAYALAVNLASKANIVNHSLYTVLLPRVAQLQSRDGVRSYLRQALLRGGVVAVALALCIPLAQPFVLIIYGSQFEQTIPWLQLLLGVVIFDVLATPALLLPLAYGRPRVMAGADGVRAVTLSLVAFGLVPGFGPTGAIVARLAARLAGAVLVLGLLARSGAAFEVQHKEAASVPHSG
jgi:O-antigen/teichoic acid export membrane protein